MLLSSWQHACQAFLAAIHEGESYLVEDKLFLARGGVLFEYDAASRCKSIPTTMEESNHVGVCSVACIIIEFSRGEHEAAFGVLLYMFPPVRYIDTH